MSAQRTLERLFERAEGAASRQSSSRASVTMTAASCPEYHALQTLDEFENYHAHMKLAERTGCVSLEWTKTGGAGRGLQRVVVLDAQALAKFLGRPMRADLVEQARRLVSQRHLPCPIVDEVITRWQEGKLVRACGPEAAQELADALRVAEDALLHPHTERLLRSESVRLFRDSKRIERLVPWLDVLSSGQCAPSGLSLEDILAQFGLRRVPQPALISGTGSVEWSGQWLTLQRPYLGVPPESVTRMKGEPNFVMTVENLTSFHEAILRHPDHRGWLLYTGGMPSPSWRRWYARVLDALPGGCPVYHWGDIDQGGFRIALALKRVAEERGHLLQPWMMSPEAVMQRQPEAVFRPCRGVRTVIGTCAQIGWHDVAKSFQDTPIEIEQEALRAELPTSPRF